MKKIIKKQHAGLHLDRHTVRELSRGGLDRVAGATTNIVCGQSAASYCSHGCGPTWDVTCHQ